MNINWEEIKTKCNDIGRHDLMERSAVRDNNFLNEFVRKLEPKPEGIIEIGTCNGIATTVFASIGKVVYTYDIAHRDAEFVWNLFGIRNKVRYYVAASQKGIDLDIRACVRNRITMPKFKINFNFAFIDGWHEYENVKHDFELVKFCGRVLFHDYFYPPVRRFLDELGAESIGPKHRSGYHRYGYWEDKK